MTARNGKNGKPKKTGTKTGTPGIMTSPVNGATAPTGAHPDNTGGKPGRSGRKPNWWKEFCAEVLERDETKAAIKAALEDRDTRGFPSLVKTIAEYAEGLPHDPNAVASRDQLEAELHQRLRRLHVTNGT